MILSVQGKMKYKRRSVVSVPRTYRNAAHNAYMNLQKLTQKSLEAVQQARDLALENGNQQLHQSHLLLALLRQEDGLIPEMLRSLHVSLTALDSEISTSIGKLPKVGGSIDPERVYLSRELNDALSEAEKQAADMKDEYVSVEHLMLGLITKADRVVKDIFSRYGITKEIFLTALKNIRGNRQVTVK